jgi:hypothetical protein
MSVQYQQKMRTPFEDPPKCQNDRLFEGENFDTYESVNFQRH